MPTYYPYVTKQRRIFEVSVLNQFDNSGVPKCPSDLGKSFVNLPIVFRVEDGFPVWTDERYCWATMGVDYFEVVESDPRSGGRFCEPLEILLSGPIPKFLISAIGMTAAQHMKSVTLFIISKIDDGMDWAEVIHTYFFDKGTEGP